MPQTTDFFTSPYLLSDSVEYIPPYRIFFILETIGSLLYCGTDSSLLVRNQVKVLLKDLKFLYFLSVDIVQCSKGGHGELAAVINAMGEQVDSIFVEFEAVCKEVRLFLHSFFFTTDLVTMTKMDLAISVLLERTEIVKVKIKDYCTVVYMKMNCGIRRLQVAESPSEVSSFQYKSIPMADELIVGLEDMSTQVTSKLIG
ncbi:Hypothetical predicted protein [Olea europaea subsp. europaea]|uniref:Uncharacterized protein n=1 Tax=Olea europaea subsp. europaea TaxID=158383 RepID=A0A8S0PW48_OLEEU|nr:Hypothetical predicted protein [Olea europaea subsp. europaea]